MYYSFATMQRYADAQDHETKPYWCVVIKYDENDPRGPFTEYLTGPSLQNLTKDEAKRKADELDLEFREGRRAA